MVREVHGGLYRNTNVYVYMDNLTIKDKDYNYKTQSDFALEDLKLDATNEKYYESIKTEYEALLNKMAANKKDDLIKIFKIKR